MTGVDRGAAQYGPVPWREGDYHFRLSPATGDHIVSGVALASADLPPPFSLQNGLLPGNQSSLPCDPSEGVCLEDRNHTLTPGQHCSASFVSAQNGIVACTNTNMDAWFNG